MVVVRFPKDIVTETKTDYRGLLVVLVLLASAAGVLVRLKKLSIGK
jgi:hypothetical protein